MNQAKRVFVTLAAAALALAVAACSAPQAASPAPSRAPAAADAVQGAAGEEGTADAVGTEGAVGAGTVHALSNVADGGRYDLQEVTDAENTAYNRLVYTDYGRALAVPVCNDPACAHSDPSCAAWEFPYSGQPELYAEDGGLYRIYPNGAEGNWQSEKLDKLTQELARGGRQYAHIEVSGAADEDRTVLCALAGNVQDMILLQGRPMADSRNLYLDLLRFHVETDEAGNALEETTTHTLEAVDKADGTVTVLATWPKDDDPYDNRLVGGSGRSLYFYSTILDPQSRTATGGMLRRLDLDTGAWEDLLQWQDVYGTQTDESWMPEQLTQVVSAPDGAPLLLRTDRVAGTLTEIDPGTGAEKQLCGNLPDGEASADWKVLENWYLMELYGKDPLTGEYRLQSTLIPRAGGDAVPLLLTHYDSVKAELPVEIRDEYNGRFYCMTGWEETSFQGLNKDGTPYTGTNFREVYAMLPVEDALAGTPNYTPIQS